MMVKPITGAARRRRTNAVRMTVRCATALVGGYAAAAVVATLIARLLPTDRVEASTWPMLSSFAVYAGFGLWAFHEPRVARVTAVIWSVAAVGGVALWLLGVRP